MSGLLKHLALLGVLTIAVAFFVVVFDLDSPWYYALGVLAGCITTDLGRDRGWTD